MKSSFGPERGPELDPVCTGACGLKVLGRLPIEMVLGTVQCSSHGRGRDAPPAIYLQLDCPTARRSSAGEEIRVEGLSAPVYGVSRVHSSEQLVGELDR